MDDTTCRQRGVKTSLTHTLSHTHTQAHSHTCKHTNTISHIHTHTRWHAQVCVCVRLWMSMCVWESVSLSKCVRQRETDKTLIIRPHLFFYSGLITAHCCCLHWSNINLPVIKNTLLSSISSALSSPLFSLALFNCPPHLPFCYISPQRLLAQWFPIWVRRGERDARGLHAIYIYSI